MPSAEKDHALLEIHAQPRSSDNKLVSYSEDTLKIRLKAPAVEGQANSACVRFLAELFGLPQRAVVIKAGLKSRTKLIELTGITTERVREIISARLDEESVRGKKWKVKSKK